MVNLIYVSKIKIKDSELQVLLDEKSARIQKKLARVKRAQLTIFEFLHAMGQI